MPWLFNFSKLKSSSKLASFKDSELKFDLELAKTPPKYNLSTNRLHKIIVWSLGMQSNMHAFKKCVFKQKIIVCHFELLNWNPCALFCLIALFVTVQLRLWGNAVRKCINAH